MEVRLSVREVETVPEEASVQDFDQLDTDIQQYIAELTRGEPAIEAPADVARVLVSCGLIKYTRYLRIYVP
jgi:hypothetical protein